MCKDRKSEATSDDWLEAMAGCNEDFLVSGGCVKTREPTSCEFKSRLKAI